MTFSGSRLGALASEAIHIIREATAEARNPEMLFSARKDSTVMAHLVLRAFCPGKPAFPLLHIDSTWEFQSLHDTTIMRTELLKKALDAGGYDIVFGGARRDEEKSRAKERMVSIRNSGHTWEPRKQRPELWQIDNTRLSAGQSARSFPRPMVARDGILIVVDDIRRMNLRAGETIQSRSVRFRTLGCWRVTGAIASGAISLEQVFEETFLASNSERQGRTTDGGNGGSLEQPKREGYF